MNESKKYELEELLPEGFESNFLTESDWEYINDIRDDKDAVIAYCDSIRRDFEYEEHLMELEYLNGIDELD